LFFNIFRLIFDRSSTGSLHVYRGSPVASDDHVALTIGNFDGVHRAHQAMLARVTEAAADLRLAPAVLTFDPHPREFFSRDGAPGRLSSVRAARAFRGRRRGSVYSCASSPRRRIDGSGVHRAHPSLSLRVRWILVGDDFRSATTVAILHCSPKQAISASRRCLPC
jgi:riboflavin kinase/FMN adenylyltransferase